jgi:RNA polymerase sigma factor (sigma-70 family)
LPLHFLLSENFIMSLLPLPRFRSSAPHSAAPDADLIRLCLDGEAAAWDALIDRYSALIYSLCLRMGLSAADAEDTYQDVCVLLLNHLGNLRDTTRLAGWLASTTKREIWRVQKKRGVHLASELSAEGWEMETASSLYGQAADNPEADVLAVEEQQTVRQALHRMPDKCRRLLTLLYCTDPTPSYQEISEHMAFPVGSIGPNRARCLQNLRKLLAGNGYE